MPKEINRMIAAEMEQRYPKGTNYLVVGFEKLTGPETAQFRKLLRDSRIHFEVVKNSVAARVLEGSGLGAGAKFLQGPCALVTRPGGPAGHLQDHGRAVEETREPDFHPRRLHGWRRVREGRDHRAGEHSADGGPARPDGRQPPRADGAHRRRVPEHFPEPRLRSRRHPESEGRDESAAQPASGSFWTRPRRSGCVVASLSRAWCGRLGRKVTRVTGRIECGSPWTSCAGGKVKGQRGEDSWAKQLRPPRRCPRRCSRCWTWFPA